MAAAVNLTPEQLSTRGRAGAYALHAQRDPRETTAAARAAFRRRFEPDDPDLSDAERERRTDAALKAYMTGLSLKASKARSA